MIARDRLAAPVVAIYWLLLAGGVVLYGACVSTDALVPLGLGALLGSTLGHVLALKNVRLWLVVALLALVLYFGVPIASGMHVPRMFWLAFAPSAACAYASLAERGSLVAAWFPVVLWMLTILDRTRGVRALDGVGIVLLGVVALGFLALLRARETRRVGLWRTTGPLPIAAAAPVRVQREAPESTLARAAWSFALVGATLGATAFVGPKLWHVESSHVHVASAGPGLPCCPANDEEDHTRVREYLDLGRGQSSATDHWNGCTSCVSAAPPSALRYRDAYNDYYVPDTYASPPGPDLALIPAEPLPPAVGSYEVPAGRSTPQTFAPPPPPSLSPSPSPIAQADAPPPPPIAPTYAPPPPPPSPSPSPPPSPPPASASSPITTGMTSAPMPPHAPPTDTATPILHVLLLLLAGAIASYLLALLLRPIRRAVTLRHLRRPFWDETVDQRVSNSWQLALVGLRDAGWRHDSGESPRELARRIGISGLDRCAQILERARYGVGITDDDLAEMSSTAESVYREAHASAPPLARALGWLRRPLV